MAATPDEERYYAIGGISSPDSCETVDIDMDVTWLSNAALGCVASACRYCGQEVRKALSPRGRYPWLNLRKPTTAAWRLDGTSKLVIVLTFALDRERLLYLQRVARGLTRECRVWLSNVCATGLPKSSAPTFLEEEDRREYWESRRQKWGAGRCCMAIVPFEEFRADVLVTEEDIVY